jgi:hypothetical protein
MRLRDTLTAVASPRLGQSMTASAPGEVLG